MLPAGGVGPDLRGLHPAGAGPGSGRGSGGGAAHRRLQDSVVMTLIIFTTSNVEFLLCNMRPESK